MPHLVTSAQTDPHVLSSNDARLMAGIYGNGSYVLPVCNRMAATMVNTNTLRILDGDALTCGRHWAIDDAYEEYDVENGTPGMKRIDLVVARIKTAPTETIEIVVLKGEEVASNPVTPGYVEGDLNAGDTITEMPLYTIPIDGINPGEPVPKFTVSESMTQAWDSLSQDGRQTGIGRMDCPANSTVESAIISFPKAYRYPPLVSVCFPFDGIMTPETAADMEFTPFAITTTGFRVKVRNGGTYMHAGRFDWQAYGSLAS